MLQGVELSSVYTNGLCVICINWLRWIVGDYAARTHWAEAKDSVLFAADLGCMSALQLSSLWRKSFVPLDPSALTMNGRTLTRRPFMTAPIRNECLLVCSFQGCMQQHWVSVQGAVASFQALTFCSASFFFRRRISLHRCRSHHRKPPSDLKMSILSTWRARKF